MGSVRLACIARIAIGTTVVVLLTACGTAQHRIVDRHPQRVSAAREQAWISKLQKWVLTEVSQGSFRDCAARTARAVGEAPSRDLAPVGAALASTCGAFKAYHADEDAAFKKHDAKLYERSRVEEARGEKALSHLQEVIASYRPGQGYQALPVKTGVTDVSRVEPNFGRVASAVAGQAVRVRCWSAGDWPRIEDEARTHRSVSIDYSGFAWFLEQATDLAPQVCHSLALLRYGQHPPADIRLAFAVGVLAHEASHLVPAYEDVEANAECFGMQRIDRTARLLGASSAESRRLASIYWQRIYPDNAPSYTSSECHNGGLLDLRPRDPVWP
jgi:hypothetical protein